MDTGRKAHPSRAGRSQAGESRAAATPAADAPAADSEGDGAADATQPLHVRIEERLRAAVARAVGAEHRETDPLLRPAAQTSFGDFQANLAMGLAKRVGAKPRDLATRIVAALEPEGLFSKVDVAGPGFINLTVDDRALAEAAARLGSDPRLGVEPVPVPMRVVVDYSAPNVAKEMLVHHLRSTVIGDAIARVLAFIGHEVIRQNHIGDWGTQFGMLLEYLDEHPELRSGGRLEIGDLNAFYQEAKRRFDQDEDFARRSRARVVELQAGEVHSVASWQQLVDASLAHFEAIYARLDVLLEPEDIRAESAYNDSLPQVIDALADVGLLEESEGARVVYPEGFKGKDGEPFPVIVRKSDGGYLYATTDLAAARFRVEKLRADRVIYLSDARQSDHFAMVFQIVRQAGWAPERIRWDHVPFGSVLGPDRRPFKTREGGTVRLAEVLDEAQHRARRVIEEKNPSLPAAEADEVARAVGIGAIKYSDLSSDRVKDYVFDWDRMLSLEGNTAPYLINAYVRVRSIFRKLEREFEAPIDAPIQITDPAERALLLHLVEFSRVVHLVADTLEPHRLCTYLYELAARLHRFYERCPVMRAPEPAVRESRLALSGLVGRTLERGLDLLGIRVVSRM